MRIKNTFGKKFFVFAAMATVAAAFLVSGFYNQKRLTEIYQGQASPTIFDRKGNLLATGANQRGYFNQPLTKIPPRFKELLLKKEDRWFYYHLGVNPVSIGKELLSHLGFGKRTASSTISQQVAKILLGQERQRNLKNKIGEIFYALSLETYKTKDEILEMYVNSVYFGNQTQGIVAASRLYFGKDPEMLADAEILQLLAAISSPSRNNPAKKSNEKLALSLAENLGLDSQKLMPLEMKTVKANLANFSFRDNSLFELQQFLTGKENSHWLTIDKEITTKARAIVKENLETLAVKNARNAAVVIIKLPENEILALIGSPDPTLEESGYKINMASEPRPIGSTIKPFIYLKAFESGLRPYTLVDDREYKYITAVGFPLFPKNFDYQYRGEVNLHYALSNSLNVPAVKVLEYVGLENFYQFLEKDLNFQPIQPLENYQLGIALGGLEMSLFDLARYFTIFANNGFLKDIRIHQNESRLPDNRQPIAPLAYVQMVNKILNDRKTGVEQFGLKSELNLFQDNYALKTGTSRNFRDSWVIGYTPDFLVAVWVGNADASPTDAVSGQTGAGLIWAQTMELLFNSEYNKKTPFDFSLLKEFENNGQFEYGLRSDDYQKAKNALKERDRSFVLFPHDGDTFLLNETTEIPLEAATEASWYLNNVFFGKGKKLPFAPKETGVYRIKAKSDSFEEEITVIIGREL